MDTDQSNSNRPHWLAAGGQAVDTGKTYGVGELSVEFVKVEASDTRIVSVEYARPAAPNAVQRKFGLVGAIAQTRMVSSWQLWASAGWTGRLVRNLSDCVHVTGSAGKCHIYRMVAEEQGPPRVNCKMQ